LVPVFIEGFRIFYAIVDSGANISLFQYEIAKLLGIHVHKGKKIPLAGIGGRIYGYLHRLNLTVGSHRFSCQVCFSQELRVPLNILGRKDFFSQFRITFDEQKKLTILDRH